MGLFLKISGKPVVNTLLSQTRSNYPGISFVDAAGPATFVIYICVILLRDTGATLSTSNAFLLLQDVESPSLRLERHAENTKKAVKYLVNYPQVEKVNHPNLSVHPNRALYTKYFLNGGTGILTFEIKGGQEEDRRFMDNLKLFPPLVNIANVKDFVVHSPPSPTLPGRIAGIGH